MATLILEYAWPDKEATLILEYAWPDEEATLILEYAWPDEEATLILEYAWPHEEASLILTSIGLALGIGYCDSSGQAWLILLSLFLENFCSFFF